MMKRFTAILLCLVLVVCLVACTGEGNGSTTTEAQTTAGATVPTDGTTADNAASANPTETSKATTFGDIDLPKIEF